MLPSEILKLDPLPTTYEELVELMKEPFWREDRARYEREAMMYLRDAIDKELSRCDEPSLPSPQREKIRAYHAKRVEELKNLAAATRKPKNR